MTVTTLQHDLESAYRSLLGRRQRRRRLARLGSLGGGVGLLLAGAALGASVLLGWPAPAHVQQELAAVDTGSLPIYAEPGRRARAGGRFERNDDSLCGRPARRRQLQRARDRRRSRAWSRCTTGASWPGGRSI